VVRVAYRRERQVNGQSKADVSLSWRQRAILERERYRITVSGTRWEGDPEIASTMLPLVSLHEKLVRVVSRKGELVDVEGIEAAKVAMGEAFATPGRTSPPSRAVLDVSADVLKGEAARNWAVEVGSWNGLDLEVGELYETESVPPVALARPVAVRMEGTVRVTGRVACAQGFSAPRCVALKSETRMDAEALEKVTRALLGSAGVEVPNGAASGAASRTEVTLVTEPDRLLPHRVELVTTVTTPPDRPGTNATETVDRTEWRYEYGTPSTAKGVSGRSPSELDEDCERGDTEACLISGLDRLEPDSGRRAPALAAPYLERACERGHGLGCERLAGLYEKGEGVAQDLSRAAATYEKGCRAGQARSCESAGTAHEKGRGVPQNHVRAAELFEKALGRYSAGCGQGDESSCSLAAFLLGNELAATPDAGKRRAEFFGRACELGGAYACGHYATELWRGKVVSPDHPRAAVLAKRACDGGVGSACSALGVAYHAGEGVQKDDAAGARYCELGCEKKDARGCLCCAQDLYFGRGVSKDLDKAYALHLRTCEMAGGDACTWAGRALVTGKGVPRDEARGASLLQKACDSASARGCTVLGEYLHGGRELAKDLPRAAALFQRGCELGDAHACVWTGFVRLKGLGTERDRGRAIEAYRKACSGADQDGCRALKSIESGHEEGPEN
jgi:TPR repeat protein